MSVKKANQLFRIVFLNKYRRNLIVPSNWCSPFDLASEVNFGVNRNQNRTVFYTNDLNTAPRFGIGIADAFDENVHGCHWGKIVRCFGEFYRFIPNNLKRSSGRTTAQLHSITPQEFDVAMTTTTTEFVDRAETKIEGFREEVSGLRQIRCANKRPRGDNMLLEINDSDIENIQDDIDDFDSDYEIELLMPKPVNKEFDADGNLVDNISSIDAQKIKTVKICLIIR